MIFRMSNAKYLQKTSKNMKKAIFLLILAAVVVASCSKRDDDHNTNPNAPKTMSELKVPAGFSFSTDQMVKFELKALANNDAVIPGVRFDVYTDFPSNGGVLLMNGATGPDGVFRTNQPLPAILKKVVVTTKYIGLPRETEVEISNGKVAYTFGGRSMVMKSGGRGIHKASNIGFYYMGSFNNLGVPNYLEPVNEVVDPQFLADINNTFPEYLPIDPVYLNPDFDHDVKLNELSDVWVTFVSEGADFKNTLGYFKYDLSNPPTSPAQIDSGMIIFPNASFLGSGGGLVTGNKVHLGQFPAGTGIGFFIKTNAFSNGQVGSGFYTYYTNPAWNPEADPAKKKHSVMVIDNARNLLLLGFEDLPRDGYSDDDFNDVMFLVHVSPFTSVSICNFPIPDYTGTDTDGDGIPDNFDEYPNDPERAFNCYYPAKDVFGTLAYEDLWPSRGDYDFNDKVINYNYHRVRNANNLVVDLKSTFVLRAMGASFHNGFGFQFDVPSSAVESVTGSLLTEGIVTLNPNGTEAGQSKATIIAYEDGYKLLPHTGGGVIGVNTTPGAPYVTPDTLRLSVHFQDYPTVSALGTAPFNPFIFIRGDRGREVHLPDLAPTALANPAYFGTFDDNSIPAENRYYKSANHLPWAINIVESFDYPIEKAAIINAHLKFAEWAESNGILYPDWYKNLPGYRNPLLIYNN